MMHALSKGEIIKEMQEQSEAIHYIKISRTTILKISQSSILKV
jgi:hypothetical protein